MKNFQYINNKLDLHDFFESQWKSQSFKNKTYKNKGLESIVKKACGSPKIICEYDDESVERLVFTSWMHILPVNASYTVPLFYDLRIVHELTHMNMREVYVGAKPNQLEWSVQILEEEFIASVLTEQVAYFNDPDMRNEDLMPESIFYDQFKKREQFFLLECMNESEALELWMSEITEYKKLLGMKTIRATNEHELKSVWYAENSSYWTMCFDKVYKPFEDRLRLAFDNHQDKCELIMSLFDSVSTDGIPFINEHFKFMDYVNNKERLAELNAIKSH